MSSRRDPQSLKTKRYKHPYHNDIITTLISHEELGILRSPCELRRGKKRYSIYLSGKTICIDEINDIPGYDAKRNIKKIARDVSSVEKPGKKSEDKAWRPKTEKSKEPVNSSRSSQRQTPGPNAERNRKWRAAAKARRLRRKERLLNESNSNTSSNTFKTSPSPDTATTSNVKRPNCRGSSTESLSINDTSQKQVSQAGSGSFIAEQNSVKKPVPPGPWANAYVPDYVSRYNKYEEQIKEYESEIFNLKSRNNFLRQQLKMDKPSIPEMLVALVRYSEEDRALVAQHMTDPDYAKLVLDVFYMRAKVEEMDWRDQILQHNVQASNIANGTNVASSVANTLISGVNAYENVRSNRASETSSRLGTAIQVGRIAGRLFGLPV